MNLTSHTTTTIVAYTVAHVSEPYRHIVRDVDAAVYNAACDAVMLEHKE